VHSRLSSAGPEGAVAPQGEAVPCGSPLGEPRSHITGSAPAPLALEDQPRNPLYVYYTHSGKRVRWRRGYTPGAGGSVIERVASGTVVEHEVQVPRRLEQPARQQARSADRRHQPVPDHLCAATC
jgi:hypothetical protein